MLWADSKLIFLFDFSVGSPNRNSVVHTILISVALFSSPHSYPRQVTDSLQFQDVLDLMLLGSASAPRPSL